MFKSNKIKKSTAFIFLIALLFACIFVRSLTFDDNSVGYKKIAAYVVALLIVVLPTLGMMFSNSFSKGIETLFNRLGKGLGYIRNNPWSAVKLVLVYIVGVVFSLVAVKICRVLGVAAQSNVRFLLFWVLVTFSFITIFIYKKKDIDKPEVLFLILSIMMGLYFVSMYTIASWDEQIHFMNSNDLFRFFGRNELLSNILFSDTLGNHPYDQLDAAFRARITRYYPFEFNACTLAYLPEFIGLVIGRGLGISFSHTFILGKLMNLFFYSGVMYFAIKITPFAKNALMAIGLSGTALFMAGSYSYDPWVIAFLALGYAFIFKCYEVENGSLGLRSPLLGILFIFLGCMPKAIYFPMFAAFLFIPGERFKEKKHKRIVVIMAVLAVMALMFLIIVPNFLMPSASASDVRGGSDVNSHEQLLYIIHNPMKYAYTLFMFFVQNYLPLEYADAYLSFFAYHGKMSRAFLPVITIILATILEVHKPGKKKALFRFVNYFMMFGCLILIATSLYVTFTPVGLNTVNGCQPRYMLPLLFPALYLLVPDTFTTNVKNSSLTTLTACAMVFNYFFSIFSIFYLGGMF